MKMIQSINQAPIHTRQGGARNTAKAANWAATCSSSRG